MEEVAGIGGLGEVPSLEVVTTAEKVAEEGGVAVMVVAAVVVATVVVVVVVAAMGVMVVEAVHGIDVIPWYLKMCC
jgi:hypothetical protein